MSFFNDVERDLVVAARTDETDEIAVFELVSHNGRDLPAWEAGSHIDVILPATPSGEHIERQYSLCGDPSDRGRWQIAVLREADGRGGSSRIHDTVVVGQRLRVRGPRNHFAFEAGGIAAPRVRFIAGGIGITPIRAMINEADSRGIDWTLAYAGRSRSTMAFASELESAFPDRVRLFPGDESVRLDVDATISEAIVPVYACGPTRLLEAVEAAGGTLVDRMIHVERFEAKEFGPPLRQEPFSVELALSGATVEVATDKSILDAVEEQAPEAVVLSSCRRGTCGTCEVPVLEGEVEHRDSVLTEVEQEQSAVMMMCVSRSLGPHLVLDA